ncbi:lipopolysaccharide biosynthesis protein [Geminocystis sp. NIES-3709]|uniref:lipopolysaccharide biosynthesis protein n=1 Tax=Geminocystis sp. NIES-3709 TaxID=1617448 RepID=UPI0005FC68A0|nr:oligosaccharide flippase family protein [Geminocystis sp. NIES-3709]BAQ64043.1 membrane protein [Geminocystis sp. NIES-3709]
MENEPKSSLVSSTIWVSVAELLFFPTGFITIAFLLRKIGPDGYGLFALASGLIAWIEWIMDSIFSNTTVKLISQSQSWQFIANGILKIQLSFSLAIFSCLILLTPWISELMHEPSLKPLLYLFALEIPLFNLAQLHQNILEGIGNFNPRAMAISVRWLSRMFLIIFLVELGMSVTGAIMGGLIAIILDLWISRQYVRPSLFGVADFQFQKLLNYAVPLFIATLCLRIDEKLDLFALKILGGSLEEIGLYASAQNIALLGQFIVPALVPITITTLTRIYQDQQIISTKQFIRNTFKIGFYHLPLAGIISVCSSEILSFLFGNTFDRAAPILSVLIFSSISSMMIAVIISILIGLNKPKWTFLIALPMPFLAFLGYWWLIPKYGSFGASIIHLVISIIACCIGFIVVYQFSGVSPPLLTFIRSSLVSVVVILIAFMFPFSGFFLIIKLMFLTIISFIILLLWGEFNNFTLSFKDIRQ